MSSQTASDRNVLVAVAMSTLLHALLFAIRTPAVSSEQAGPLPDLRVLIEQPASREVDDRVLAATRRPTAPSQLLATSAAAARVEDRSADVEPQPLPKPAVESLAMNDTQLTNVADAPPVASSQTETTADNVVTTTSVSTESVAVQGSSPEMTAGERHMLAKQFEKMTRHVTAMTQLPEAKSWKYKDRQYSAIVRRLPAANDMAIEQVEVEITTEENGVQLRSRAQLKRLAFSHFTQLVDEWDQGVQLHNDEIRGRFHSNSELVVGWDKAAVPHFLGQVTTAARGFTIASALGNHTRSDIFRGGIETGTHRVLLQGSRAISAAAAVRSANAVRFFDHDTRVILNADGSFGWRAAASHGPMQREELSGAPMYLVARDGVTIYVQGIVRGSVLIYSPKDIVVTGSLRYARDPRIIAASEDYLGLVADRDIVVADRTETGSGDLEVDAALYALRRFTVSHTYDAGSATLSVFGSLTAGTMSETEPRFATNIEFDSRFERVRPPGFPMTDRYEVTDWAQQWRPANDTPRD